VLAPHPNPKCRSAVSTVLKIIAMRQSVKIERSECKSKQWHGWPLKHHF